MGLPQDLWRRQTRLMDSEAFARRYQVTESTLQRLGLESTLHGHGGCVNCLQWSSDGQLLASGSDDCKVILWQPFFKNPRSEHLRTQHKGNIFSVKFMPFTGNRMLATGAGDNQIQLHDAHQQKTVTTFASHFKRVKRLDVAHDCPNLIWSASEDGTVLETDIRAKPTETSVLINLLSVLGRGAQAKCVSVNQRKPEWIAVGANDAFVRVYDRRKLKAQLVEFPEGTSSAPRAFERRSCLARAEKSVSAPLSVCAKYFVAGHLRFNSEKAEPKSRFRRQLASTYVTFSPDGNELLVNLGGEQIYLYDLSDPRCSLLDSADFGGFLDGGKEEDLRNGRSSKRRGAVERTEAPLTEAAERLKSVANTEFGDKMYSTAIFYYNQAIELCDHPILYGNRAAAYIKRKWDGDTYAALRDCFHVLKLNPGHVKSHLRLCRCLLELNFLKEARKAVDVFKARFPNLAASADCSSIEKDIDDFGENGKKKAKPAEGGGGGGSANGSLEFSMQVFARHAFDADTDGSDEEEDEEGGNNDDGRSTPPPTAAAGVGGNIRQLEKEEELTSQKEASDYSLRFCGHCNTTTDIKEANFYGNDGQFVVAGSDDGKLFCWNRRTTNISKVLEGDESIVNCVQPHPHTGLVATSGIDPVVRVWAPLPEDGTENDRQVSDVDDAALSNHRRMKADPFEILLMDIGGYGPFGVGGDAAPDG